VTRRCTPAGLPTCFIQLQGDDIPIDSRVSGRIHRSQNGSIPSPNHSKVGRQGTFSPWPTHSTIHRSQPSSHSTASMSTSLLRVRRSLGVALYGEVVECELLQPGPPRIVAVKCMSLPRALRVRAQSAADQAMDDPLQECRVADLLTQNGGHSRVVDSYFHFQEDECLYLVNELCGLRSLSNH
jgi:hypothetical protein